MTLTRDQALTILKKYNQEPFHLRHALTVEAVMKWFARELDYAGEEGNWGSSDFCTISTLNSFRRNIA